MSRRLRPRRVLYPVPTARRIRANCRPNLCLIAVTSTAIPTSSDKRRARAACCSRSAAHHIYDGPSNYYGYNENLIWNQASTSGAATSSECVSRFKDSPNQTLTSPIRRSGHCPFRTRGFRRVTVYPQLSAASATDRSSQRHYSSAALTPSSDGYVASDSVCARLAVGLALIGSVFVGPYSLEGDMASTAVSTGTAAVEESERPPSPEPVPNIDGPVNVGQTNQPRPVHHRRHHGDRVMDR
jgi:hypothetical protein